MFLLATHSRLALSMRTSVMCLKLSLSGWPRNPSMPQNFLELPLACQEGLRSIFSIHFCGSPPSPALANLFQDQVVESDLTVSTTVTVAGEGCFHPGACLTSATPGATAVPATATVTPEAERLPKAGASSPTQPEESSFFSVNFNKKFMDIDYPSSIFARGAQRHFASTSSKSASSSAGTNSWQHPSHLSRTSGGQASFKSSRFRCSYS